jgi:hypothetical protein
MNRLSILIFSIFIFGQLKSQTIEIGQDAEQIKKIIEWTTKDHNKADSYGTYSPARASLDVLYNNGQISDVIQCFENQYYINFRMAVNYCKHYIMESGKLAYTLTQYENISYEKLIEVSDGMYGERKIDDLYFDKEYKHYSKIYLAKNGQATIEWRQAELSQIPLSVRKDISNKQNSSIENLRNAPFQLDGRNVLSLSKPRYPGTEEGVVVVQIVVDNDGIVQKVANSV